MVKAMGEAERAYEKALAFLEKRDRTKREVADRLAKAGYSGETIERTIERLREAGFVDDADYAARYLDVLVAKGGGSLRIREEMRRKGLPDGLVRDTIEAGIGDERARALAAAQKALASVPEGTDPQKAIARVSRKLISLGFSYSVIGELMPAVRSGLRDEEREV